MREGVRRVPDRDGLEWVSVTFEAVIDGDLESEGDLESDRDGDVLEIDSVPFAEVSERDGDLLERDSVPFDEVNDCDFESDGDLLNFVMDLVTAGVAVFL